MTIDAADGTAGTGADVALAQMAPLAPEEPAREQVGALFRAHAVGLVRTAVLLLGDQPSAEDVVQDVFARLQRSPGRLRATDNPVPYLRRAVINGCRSVHRSRRRTRLLRMPHDPPVWSAEAAALAGEDRRAVLAAVARLTGRQREVLVLRYYAGMADLEIAATLQISRGTVSSTISRALGALARELREEL